MQLLHRRVLVLVLAAWVPLLLLSTAEGHAWGDSVRLPFLRDVELHIRLLITLPLMILAELIVHQRMRPVVGRLKPSAAGWWLGAVSLPLFQFLSADDQAFP